MIRLLLATPDPELTTATVATLREVDEIEVVATAANATDVINALAGDEVALDVLVLHEHLGPLPVLDLARDLNHRFPQVGVVLLSSDPSLELLRSAMSAGVRSVTKLPLTVAELSSAILDANEWSQAVRDQLSVASDEQRSDRLRGRIVAVAGSKGGVGTTTIATQVALELQRRSDAARICLVDLDLQTGDVRSFLDLTHRRSITDLIEVAGELTTGHLADAMFAHPTGLRVLLPPINGEDAEDLDGPTTARILGGIRARFDTVVVDVGSVGTEASATAIELADDVLVVCTPDVVSLRAANRAVGMWRRLRLRDGATHAVLNRASRDREVQPSLAERVLGVPLLDTQVPERPQDLEHATNTGVPERLEGQLRKALEKLTGELTGDQPTTVADVERGAQDRDEALAERVTAGQTGSISAEFVGLILPIALTLLLVWQFILTGYTTLLANRAADDGARHLAIEGRDQSAIEAAAASNVHGHWRRELSVAPVQGNEVRVSIPVPILLPGMSSPWTVTTSAGAVIEGSSAGIVVRTEEVVADASTA